MMMRTFFTTLSVFLLSAVSGATVGCHHSADDTCTVSEASSCEGLDITFCQYGRWQTQSCQTRCLEEFGSAARSCGYDPEQGGEACLCATSDDPPPSSSGGGGSGGGSCSDDFDACDKNGDCCGFSSGDAYCVGDGGGGQCRPICYADDECGTGCCAELENGESVCSPSDHCGGSCKDTGSICESNGECCDYGSGGAYCVTFGDDSYASCAETCSDGSDCSSGCCVDLDNGDSVCASSVDCANYTPGLPVAAVPAGSSSSHRGPSADTIEHWPAVLR